MGSVQTATPVSTKRSLIEQPAFAAVPVLAIAAVRLVLWALFATRYGYFRDELYYLACGEHLAWGYVDQPPLIAVVAWFARHVLGGGLHAIRFFPALAHAGAIVIAALLAREMGARRFGQWLAALCMLVGPGALGLSHLLTMNAFEPLFWCGAALVLLRVMHTGNERLWLIAGVIAGVGLLNKYSMAFFAGAMVAGMLLTSQRKSFAKPWIWIALVIAALIALPNFMWQMHRGYPFLVLMHNVRASGRDVALGPLAFIGQTALYLMPLTAVVWMPGVVWLFTPSGKRFRALGWTFLILFAFMVASRSKIYYFAPIAPLVFGAGGALWQRILDPRPRLAWLKAVFAVLFVGFGALLAPMVLPVLSADQYLRAAEKLPFLRPPAFEHQRTGPLPQLYADMYGWREMAEKVAAAYKALPPDVREQTIVFANNYGDGSAIQFFGPQYGIPADRVYGGHQNFWFWGPPPFQPKAMIVTDDTVRSLQRWCDNVQVVDHVGHPFSRRDEWFPLLLCTGFKPDIKSAWPKLRKWN
jgi:hypothetical protein